MNIYPRKLLLASGVALAMAVMSGGVVAGEVTDARQESQIWTTYALNPHLRANDLKVSVEDGTATLTGNVEEEVSKELAKEIALGVSGITEVNNQIVVQPDYVPPKTADSRSFGDFVENASITTAVKSKLVWSKNTNGMSTKVETDAGRVTLSGTAESAEDRDLAGRLAMNTRGVSSVDNQLIVEAAGPGIVDTGKSVVGETGETISDSWITTKVKSTLRYTSNVSGSAIDVSTDKGIVTLSGKVSNGTEQALAIELAQNVRGVKSVQAQELTF